MVFCSMLNGSFILVLLKLTTVASYSLSITIKKKKHFKNYLQVGSGTVNKRLAKNNKILNILSICHYPNKYG